MFLRMVGEFGPRKLGLASDVRNIVDQEAFNVDSRKIEAHINCYVKG